MKNLLVLLFSCIATSSFEQSSNVLEETLLTKFTMISFWKQQSYKIENIDSINTYDSLQIANDIFETELIQIAKNNTSLSKKYVKLLTEEGLKIVTSTDKKLKVYSWNKLTGGTMAIYGCLIHYNNMKNNVIYDRKKSDYEEKEESAGADYSNIYQLDVNDRRYYLLIHYSKYATNLYGAGLDILAIENGKINFDTKLIKVKSHFSSSLNYEFNFSHKIYKNNSSINADITFDKKTNRISIPLVLDNGQVTHKRIIYKFNGKYFEKMN